MAKESVPGVATAQASWFQIASAALPALGSNDLTQLVLGVDRDSKLLGPVFDERNPAVIRALILAIDGAREQGRKIGICGQAPSYHPEIAELLVWHGIDSLSLSADIVIRTRMRLAELECRLEAEGGTGRS